MAVSSTFEPSGATPVPPGIGPMATLLANFSWMTVGLPASAASGSTTAGSTSYCTVIASTASRAT